MKNNLIQIFTRIFFALFIGATIIILWMAYNHIDSSTALKFGIGYLCLTFFLILYVPIVTILNSRTLKRDELIKRLLRFAIIFVLFGGLNYIFDYVFRPTSINLFRNFSVALGTAFGISYIDVILLKKKV